MKTQIVLKNQLEIDTNNLSADVVSELKDSATFLNPKWIACQNNGSGTRNVEKILKFFDHDIFGNLEMPRGLKGGVLDILQSHGVNYEIVDRTRKRPNVTYRFTGGLRDFQQKAVSLILQNDIGVLENPAESDSIIVALNLIAQRMQPTLIMTSNREILCQWREQAKTHLGMRDDEIGQVANGRKKIRNLTIATVHGLAKCAGEIRRHFGFVIVAEGHCIDEKRFHNIIQKFDSRYLLCLLNTPFLCDKSTEIVRCFFGESVHKIDSTELETTGKYIMG